MTNLTVTLADGRNRTVAALDGLSVMEALRSLDIGVEGTCGGSMTCSTCHVRVDPAWAGRLASPSEEELDRLDLSAVDTGPTSRLSCQIKVAPALDGLRLALPRKAAGLRAAGTAAAAAVEEPPAAAAPVQVEAGPSGSPPAKPPSERARLKRYNWLAEYDRDVINAIIDAGIVCQVGYVIDGMPYVTPTNHWRIDDYVYWHGSSASRMLKHQQKGIPVCFTVTHLDGIVFSRAAFNHNVKFRSVMAFGMAELCDEDVKRKALQTFTDGIAPGLWDYARPPSDQEWKASKVIRMQLDEVSGKVADGLPDEEADDLVSDRWAGHVPLRLQQLRPVADPKLKGGIPMPDFVRNFRYAGVEHKAE